MADRIEEAGGVAIHRVHRVGRKAELGTPGRVRPPRRGVQHERGAVALGELEVLVVVARQRLPAASVAQEQERREARQLDPLVEDHRRLEATVGDEHAVMVQTGEAGVHHERIICERQPGVEIFGQHVLG